MDTKSLKIGQHRNQGVTFSDSTIKLELCTQEISIKRDNVFNGRGLFAGVNHIGKGFGISPNSVENAIKIPTSTMQMKFVSNPEPVEQTHVVVMEVGEVKKKKKEGGGFKWKIKVGNQALRRLISGGIAGAVSRTAVAPLETVRTHLMVGSCGNSSIEVFDSIMKNDGWPGLFRGNFVNVIRVAPSKAIELFAYDTVLKHLTPKDGEKLKTPILASSIAGALAGFSSTLCTYPLELIKTRLTIQKGVYDNFVHAFINIVRDEGPAELYRGLTPSLIGVMPYAAANYFAYDTLRKAHIKAFKKDEIGNVMTLLIGSAAGAISSSATFPLEVARKHMQAGALNGRQYRNMVDALVSILEKEGLGGLYRGVGPSCMKLVPAAGISFYVLRGV